MIAPRKESFTDLLICEAATGKFETVVETVPLVPFVHMTHLDPVNFD